MSEQSYANNVRRGVTGPYSSNCLMAAYDRITPRLGISTETYVEYEKLRMDYKCLVGDDNNYVLPEIVRRFKEIKVQFRAELGVYTDRNIVTSSIKTREGLKKVLGDLILGGFRPAVYLDVGGLHAVGVMSADIDDEHYFVSGTWTPFRADGPVHVDDIFEYLDQPARQRRRPETSKRSLKEVNVVALPPEPRRK